MTIRVTTSAELLAAFKALPPAGGVTILLASGAGFLGGANLGGKTFAAPVILTSEDPTNPPLIGGLTLTTVKGMRITGLTFLAAGAVGAKLAVNGVSLVKDCGEIEIDHNLFQGPDDLQPYVKTVQGLFVRASKAVHVHHNEFKWMQYGLGHLENQGLLIEENHFHDLQTDAIRGGGTDDLTIRRNVIRDLRILAGDHGDGIQTWTSNVAHTTKNVLIEENLVDRGDGSVTQGVFLRDESGWGYDGVTVRGNVVFGMYYNALCLTATRTKPDGAPATKADGTPVVPSVNVRFEDNLALGYDGQEGRMLLRGIAGGSYGGNHVGMVQLADNGPDFTDAGGNVTLLPAFRVLPPWAKADETLALWLIDHGDVPRLPGMDILPSDPLKLALDRGAMLAERLAQVAALAAV